MTAIASATAYSFYKADKTAGLLCLPYLSGLIYLNVENYLAYKTFKDDEKKEAEAQLTAGQPTKKRKAL